jgi:uncharacterized protein (TIGR02145 family)
MKKTNTMKTKNLILFASLVLLNVQVYAQTFLNRNGKLTSDAAEAVSVNGAIGAANGIGRDGKLVVLLPTVTSTTGKIWMDRNLGATQVATSSTDAASYGNLYQWGRGTDGHQLRTSGTTSTLSSSDVPGNGSFILAANAPFDWRSPQNDNLWQGVNGINNPCPSGYRLPTNAELEAERATFSSNNAAGAFASVLKLPVSGSRYGSNGSLFLVGTNGYYWSSTVSGTRARNLGFNSGAAGMFTNNRANGSSVRCLKD